jgi:hypothetical protein
METFPIDIHAHIYRAERLYLVRPRQIGQPSGRIDSAGGGDEEQT